MIDKYELLNTSQAICRIYTCSARLDALFAYVSLPIRKGGLWALLITFRSIKKQSKIISLLTSSTFLSILARLAWIYTWLAYLVLLRGIKGYRATS